MHQKKVRLGQVHPFWPSEPIRICEEEPIAASVPQVAGSCLCLDIAEETFLFTFPPASKLRVSEIVKLKIKIDAGALF